MIRVGVSSCLLGQEVRWNGQHKRDAFVTEVLGAHVELVPVCPEVEVGMGVPREPIQLVVGPRLVGVESRTDHTRAMERFSARRIAELEALELSGYVFKKGSPSCGLYRVPVWKGDAATPTGTGMFARAFREAMPLVPVEEEGRLHDPRLRESFVERVHAHARLRALGRSFSRGALVEFHARHKMQLLAHGQVRYRELGRLVAAAKQHRPRALYEAYAKGFMAALERPATTKAHRNVLEHMAGHLKGQLDAGDKRELHDAIAAYAAGRVPFAVPITLLRHHVRRHGVATLASQVYLDPLPHF